jgi:hypothetical protein
LALRGQVGDELEQAPHHSRGKVKIGSEGTILFSLASYLVYGMVIIVKCNNVVIKNANPWGCGSVDFLPVYAISNYFR